MSKVDAASTNVTEEAKTVVAEKVEGPKAAPKKRGRKTKAASDAAAPAAKKTGRASKKAAPEKAGTIMHLQFGGNDVDMSKVEENIKAKFVAEGHRAGNIKSLEVYVKPEENKAWYVINDGKFDGNIDLF